MLEFLAGEARFCGWVFGKEISEIFTLSDINKAGAKFNWEKLNWINSQYIKNMEPTKLHKILKKYWSEMGWDSPSQEWDFKLTALIKDSLVLLNNAIDESKPFFSIPPLQEDGKDFLKNNECKDSLGYVLKILKDKNFEKLNKENAKEILNKISKEHSIKKGVLMKSLRVAFFGCLSGPDLIQSWELFSENKSDILRIERCITSS